MQPDTAPLVPGYRLRQQRRDRVGLALAAALSMLAGMSDAIGFMATGDFVSFMSGNTTRLAVAISEADPGVMVRLALAIVVFVIGNTLGIVVVRLGGRQAWPLLLGIGALLCVAALLPTQAHLPALACAILAMGMLNAAVEQVSGMAVGLTYVTGALSRLGRSLGRWLLGERRTGWMVQWVPWAGMFVGAVLGALLEQRLGITALLASAVLACTLGLITLGIPRRWQRCYMPR